METRNENRILQRIKELQPEMQKRFGVTRIGVFGSFARGEEEAESDVDILVEMSDPTFDRYMDLKFLLEDVFQRSVDLVLADTVKPLLKPVLEREALYA